MMQRQERLWSIILAGGEGERLRPMVQQWMGRPIPKQYCVFAGTKSMLQHTLARADRLSPPRQKMVVIGRTHGAVPWVQIGAHTPCTVVVQPRNRDTAAGILLPLTYVRAYDPHATVVVYPSDHFVYPVERFLATVRWAVLEAERLRERVILVGVVPDALELEYGWIQPGGCLGQGGGECLGVACVHEVQAFVEKPSAPRAIRAMKQGALWNTFVFAGTVSTLWALGWQLIPDAMRHFERLGQAIGTWREGAVLEEIYQEMPARNFSTLLQQVPHRIGVVPLQGVLWSDWGRPERIAATLARIGKRPACPLLAQETS